LRFGGSRMQLLMLNSAAGVDLIEVIREQS
jgi:hypothetical protein